MGGGGHGHGHGEAVTHPVEHESYVSSHEARRVPPLGSTEHLEAPRMWSEQASKIDQRPRSIWQRFHTVMRFDVFNGEDDDKMTLATNVQDKHRSIFKWLTAPTFPLKPELYVDTYTRPNPCPEEYWAETWRWPRSKYVNAKVPPPIDGKYNDYYHMLAFKKWFEMEREVYLSEVHFVYMTLSRCMLRESEKTNGMKNCRHLFHKWFAMTRAEEFHQAMLYMALTGNAAIRETPYPPNFVDEKRKMYDDWLFRTRHKRPSDDFVLT